MDRVWRTIGFGGSARVGPHGMTRRVSGELTRLVRAAHERALSDQFQA
jgi:hypothetical protein